MLCIHVWITYGDWMNSIFDKKYEDLMNLIFDKKSENSNSKGWLFTSSMD